MSLLKVSFSNDELPIIKQRIVKKYMRRFGGSTSYVRVKTYYGYMYLKNARGHIIAMFNPVFKGEFKGDMIWQSLVGAKRK